MPGQQHIGRYKVLQELGRGGMGVVYLAEDTNLERTVAVKVLPMTRKEGQQQLRERFLREARVSARLDNPFVIHLHDVGQDEDVDFIVMEYVRGRTLREVIEDTGSIPMPPDEAARLFWEICQGVEYAHRMGIIHRDLKPENIMVTDEAHIKIMDFGLAWQEEQARLTRDGAVMGTVAYFSPEQARGERADERSDIYSLGAILFEMLTNRLLFDASSPGEMIAHHLSTPPPSPRSVFATVPAGLDAIVMKCLQKKREDRFQNVAELLSELEKHLMTRNINFSQLRYGGPFGTDRRKPAAGPAQTVVSQTVPPQPTAAPAESTARPEPELGRPGSPGAYWNPPPVLRFDQQPWLEILQGLPNRGKTQDSDPAVEEAPAPPPPPAPRVAPPMVNPWDFKPGDNAADKIASDQWLKEAQENAGWGRFEQVANRIRKDEKVRADEPHLLVPDNIECKRCHTLNPGDRKYCQECAGLLTPSRYRLGQEARELTELGIMYYKQGQPDAARREFGEALDRSPEIFDAQFYMGRIELDEHHLEEADKRFRLAIGVNDRDARPYAFLADIYREQGRVDEAIRCYQQAVSLDPGNPEVRCRLAFLLSNTGQVADAIAEYQAVVKTAPEHLEAYKQLGIIFAGQDMLDESIQAFEAVTELDPQNQQAFRWLARLYARRNRYNQSEKAYQTALSFEPNDAELYAQLGTVYEAQRKEDSALKVLRQAINLDAGNMEARTRLASLYLRHNQPRMAIQELEQAVVFHPQNATLHRHLGELYLSENNLDRALEHFERAVSLDPKAAEAHSQLGKLYLRKNHDDGAVEEYQRAIKLEPYNPVYREELGMAYFAQNRPDLAVTELRKAAMLDSTNVDYQKALGLICEEAGRLDEAVQSLSKAIELSPRDALAHGLLGKVFFRQGLANFAMKELQKAVELDPNNLLLHIYMARAYSQVGQPTQAIKHFRRAIELGGSERRETRRFMAQSYQELAKAYLDSGQYRKAAEVLDASLAVVPDSAQAVHYRGLAALGMGETRKARDLLLRANAMQPQNAEVFFSLGRFHDKVGETAQALRCYREACKLAPARVDFMEGLAACLAGQKAYDEAMSVLQVALKKKPSEAANYYGMMGCWHLDKNDVQQGVKALAEAVDMGTQNVLHYLRLAQTLSGMGRKPDAAEILKLARDRVRDDDRTTVEEALKRLAGR